MGKHDNKTTTFSTSVLKWKKIPESYSGYKAKKISQTPSRWYSEYNDLKLDIYGLLIVQLSDITVLKKD